MTNKQFIEELFDMMDGVAETVAEQQLNNETVGEELQNDETETQQGAESTPSSIKAKAKMVIDDVLDRLILGGYEIESGEELLKTMQAISTYQHLD